MRYNNPGISKSWKYGEHYRALMNIQIDVVEAVVWIGQQDVESDSVNEALIDTLDALLRDILNLRAKVNQSCCESSE